MLRLRTYLTIFSAIIFPLVLLLWVRSYIYNDTVFRVGGSWAVMVDSIDGEIAAWAGRIRHRSSVIYQHDSIERDYGMRTSHLLQLVPTTRHITGLGFDYAEMDHPPIGWRSAIGPVRCVSMPLWFLVLLTGVLPARCVVSGMYWTSASAAGRCRRCRFLLSPHHLRCPECGDDVSAPEADPDPLATLMNPSDEPQPVPAVLMRDPRHVRSLPNPRMQWAMFIASDRPRRQDLV